MPKRFKAECTSKWNETKLKFWFSLVQIFLTGKRKKKTPKQSNIQIQIQKIIKIKQTINIMLLLIKLKHETGWKHENSSIYDTWTCRVSAPQWIINSEHIM